MKNKAFFLILLAVAVPLYLWDTHTLFSGLFAHKKVLVKQARVAAAASFPMLANSPKFVEKGRSPFSAYKEIPRPIVKQSAVAKAKASALKTSVTPPKVVITGILWHPTNPIAMVTLPDGSSSAVKTNQNSGNILFKTIEKTRVLVVFEGKEFWIAK